MAASASFLRVTVTSVHPLENLLGASQAGALLGHKKTSMRLCMLSLSLPIKIVQIEACQRGGAEAKAIASFLRVPVTSVHPLENLLGASRAGARGNSSLAMRRMKPVSICTWSMATLTTLVSV